MPSLVINRLERQRAEVHGVRSFMNVDECRDRMILAECLVLLADDHPDCGDCLLANTPLDPRAAA